MLFSPPQSPDLNPIENLWRPTFAHVSLENCKNTNGSFGKEKSNTWHPWQYTKRLAVVEKVDAEKKKVNK
jgi:hypothetical protein